MIIVIDGPAGSGKSSTAKEIARQTGFDYVDSGAVYRGLTYLYLECGRDQSVFLKVLKNHNLHFDFQIAEARVYSGDKEITSDIRSRKITGYVSEVAVMPEVRDIVYDILRKITGKKNAVLEGRDLGTVVFPDADLKFYLTADPEVRAKRRYEELVHSGSKVTMTDVLENLQKRDRIDSTRAIAPLKKADDAIVIDSTSMTFNEQVARILHYIRNTRTTGTVTS